MAKYEIEGNYTRVRMKLEELRSHLIKDVSNLTEEEKSMYFRELHFMIVMAASDRIKDNDEE